VSVQFNEDFFLDTVSFLVFLMEAHCVLCEVLTAHTHTHTHTSTYIRIHWSRVSVFERL